MNGNQKVEKSEKAATGGDAPKEAAGKVELIDQQPTGQSKLISKCFYFYHKHIFLFSSFRFGSTCFITLVSLNCSILGLFISEFKPNYILHQYVLK